MTAIALQIDSLLHSGPPKQVMTALYTFLKAEAFEQSAKIVEADGRIGFAAQ
jgi:hypothetical protein